MLYKLKVVKAGYHIVADTPYLCLGIINKDQALLVGEGNNITVSSMFDCKFAGFVEQPKVIPPVTPTKAK